VHLLAHLLREHAVRAEVVGAADDSARGWWNRCGDAEINDDLLASNLVPHVASDLPGDLGGRQGDLAERYYQSAQSGPRRWDCGSGCDGGGRPWDGPNGIARDQAELLRLGVAADIQVHDSREPGVFPGGWLRWAEALLPSKIDWRRALAAEIRRGLAAVSGAVDYSYRRPSRRADSIADVILPSLRRPTPEVAIVCDTSGSMHDALLARALAEVEVILTRTEIRHAPVLAVDTEVHATTRVTRAAQVRLAGGGGTDMGAGIDAASHLRPRPQVIVVLTDGHTPWPDRPPPNTAVVVGVLSDGPRRAAPPTPEWARAVTISP